MARFILDVPTGYIENNHKKENRLKQEITIGDSGNNIKLRNFLEQILNACDDITGDNSSITCIEKHNTGQFHTHTYKNKLTKKQVRVFNENPHG